MCVKGILVSLDLFYWNISGKWVTYIGIAEAKRESFPFIHYMTVLHGHITDLTMASEFESVLFRLKSSFMQFC